MSDEYEQALGAEESEPALEPGGNAHGVDDDGGPDSFESQAPALGVERIGKVRIPRGTPADRRAMADAIAAFAKDKAGEPEGDEEGDFGPYDEVPTPRPRRQVAKPAEPQQVQQEQRPPAPSLDPEVGRLREQLRAQNEVAAQKLAEIEGQRRSAGSVVDEESYLESPPKAYRQWLEAMRGEKFSDDDFKRETADFVTMLSSDVLGVQLPPETRSRIESQLARKAVSTYRSKEQRRQEAETAKREDERVQREWTDAARALDGQFRVEDTTKSYPWLASEDSPGKIVVDVIQSAMKRDGTQLTWQEAAKQANDYLKNQASRYYDKRKHLLSAAPAQPVAANGKQAAQPRTTTGTSQVTRAPEPPKATDSDPPVVRYKPNSTWDKEAHRRETRRAFAPVFQKPDE